MTYSLRYLNSDDRKYMLRLIELAKRLPSDQSLDLYTEVVRLHNETFGFYGGEKPDPRDHQTIIQVLVDMYIKFHFELAQARHEDSMGRTTSPVSIMTAHRRVILKVGELMQRAAFGHGNQGLTLNWSIFCKQKATDLMVQIVSEFTNMLVTDLELVGFKRAEYGKS